MVRKWSFSTPSRAAGVAAGGMTHGQTAAGRVAAPFAAVCPSTRTDSPLKTRCITSERTRPPVSDDFFRLKPIKSPHQPQPTESLRRRRQEFAKRAATGPCKTGGVSRFDPFLPAKRAKRSRFDFHDLEVHPMENVKQPLKMVTWRMMSYHGL